VLIREFNQAFEDENSGFRFVGGSLTRITDANEIATIEKAITAAGGLGLAPVETSMREALAAFGARPNADYDAAINKAIKAVESTAKCILKEPDKTMGAMIQQLCAALKLARPTFEEMLRNYWLWTCEVVRHGQGVVVDVDEADARYALVTCSAMINYLLVKADKQGIVPRLCE